MLTELCACAAQAIGPQLGPDLISLITTREEINDLLALDDVIDLVIPRWVQQLTLTLVKRSIECKQQNAIFPASKKL